MAVHHWILKRHEGQQQTTYKSCRATTVPKSQLAASCNRQTSPTFPKKEAFRWNLFPWFSFCCHLSKHESSKKFVSSKYQKPKRPRKSYAITNTQISCHVFAVICVLQPDETGHAYQLLRARRVRFVAHKWRHINLSGKANDQLIKRIFSCFLFFKRTQSLFAQCIW